MRLRGEIISTGDEVLTGAIVDTNAAYLAEQMSEAGVVVTRHHAVGDDLKMLSEAFADSAKRADVVVVTGGLGPTSDDLTAQAASDAAGVPLVLDKEAMAGIEKYFRSRNRHMIAANRKQAMFPRGADVLENPVGTAPGFSMTMGRAMIFFMPGVPHEMKRMMSGQVMPRIRRLQGDEKGQNMTRVLSTFGVPESEAAARLSEFSGRFPDLRLGFQVKYPGILLKVYGGDDAPEIVSQRVDEGVAWICGQLEERIVSLEGQSLEAVVGRLLVKQKATLAVAESCTGGLIANMITDVPGSSEYFLFSGVTYANRAKTDVLGVSPETIEIHGAVHEETAREMAVGARKISGADYGLSTSGIAGPDGGTDDKPVGTVCIALATPGEVIVKRRFFSFGGREMKKKMFAAAALDLMRRHLLKT